jgi:hypothetical protein
MGGVGRQETSQVIFKVVDAGGIAITGKTVNFTLDTNVGGISLSTPNAITDTNGQVFVTVSAGTISTPVRVTATTTGSIGLLTTQSGQLSISTGIPDQQNFSLVASTYNFEGWSIAGATTNITAHLADHFGNPVLDGTAINFTCEGGCSITPSCNTVAGVCSVTLTSLAGATSKPTNGRVTVLAYAVGEEGFTDLNGNGMADQLIAKQLAPLPPSPEMIDNNAKSTDLPEAWVDYNENSVRDALSEPFIDFNANLLYDAPDSNYNGVLCDHTLAAGTPTIAGGTVSVACSTKQSLHVFKQLVVVLSSSVPALPVLPASISLGGCVGGAIGAGASTPVTITDINLNMMPAGTIIAVATTNGILTTLPSYIVPNSTATNIAGLFRIEAPTPVALTPVPSIGPMTIGIRSDATVTPPVAPALVGTCTDPTPSGFLNITITTPGAAGVAGTITTYSVPVLN